MPRTPVPIGSNGAAQSFVDDLELTIDELAEWGVDYINSIVDVLMPDGRGFGQKKLSEDEQMSEYMKLRGDPAAWQNWITERVSAIQQSLTNSGLTEDVIAQAHPYDIVLSYALRYSSRLEGLLGEDSQKANEQYLQSRTESLPE